MTIEAVKADITSLKVDAIVNSANPTLLAGGGVCGAIHKAAGPELEIACKDIGKCAVGHAVITPAFRLPAKFVIHAVGPRWLDGKRDEASMLENCYSSIFGLALEEELSSIAIPSISTGIYNYPLEQAAVIAVQQAKINDRPDLEIIFVCFDDNTLAAYQAAIG
jgi:O-acetyl-ADP-ribose deacetylase (regulator of RNase III)